MSNNQTQHLDGMTIFPCEACGKFFPIGFSAKGSSIKSSWQIPNSDDAFLGLEPVLENDWLSVFEVKQKNPFLNISCNLIIISNLFQLI